jgi:hypothetical protein
MICLEAGRVVHAELEGLDGVSAFRQMCFSQKGWFRFEPGAKPPRRSMREEGIGLLLDTARRKDLADRDQSRAPVATRSSKPLVPSLAESVGSRRDVATSVGVALLLGVLVVVAFGVYAWAAS